MTIHVGAAQLIYVLLSVLGLCLSIKDHGKPRGKQNAWTSVIAAVITYSLLIWGGFFR